MTKDELQRVWILKAELKRLEQCRLNLLVAAEDLVPMNDGTPRATEVKSKVEALALKILQTDEKITEAKSELVKTEVDLTRKITEKISDPRLQKVAILRHVVCLPLNEIARRMDLSLRQIYRLFCRLYEKECVTMRPLSRKLVRK